VPIVSIAHCPDPIAQINGDRDFPVARVNGRIDFHFFFSQKKIKVPFDVGTNIDPTFAIRFCFPKSLGKKYNKIELPFGFFSAEQIQLPPCR